MRGSTILATSPVKREAREASSPRGLSLLGLLRKLAMGGPSASLDRVTALPSGRAAVRETAFAPQV